MPTWGELLKEISELKAAKTTGSPFDMVRRKYLSRMAAHTGRDTIIYATKWTQGGAEPEMISITPEDVQGFMEVVHGLKGDALDLILHSPGGSAEVTESLVTYLRSKFRHIRVLIPHAAMSAATMLACAADSIVMGKHSFLGPIDPQFIMTTELGRASVPAYAIVEQFRLAQEECKNPATMAAWLPILRQYGPALIVQCKLASQLAESLVSGWLEQYMLADAAEALATAARIARDLSDHGQHKSHSRFLGRERLKTIGLKIENLEDDPQLQDDLLSTFHACSHTLAGTPAVKVIENHRSKCFIKNHIIVIPQPSSRPAPAAAMPVPPAGPQTD